MRKRLLIIDDDKVVLELYKYILRDNFNLVLFDNPENALLYYEKNHKRIDAILCDYFMSKHKGNTIIKHLHEIEYKPSALVSGTVKEFLSKEKLWDIFLEKPFNRDYLLRGVRRLLNASA